MWSFHIVDMSKENELIEDLKLDNQICFRLYLASRLTTKLYKPLLDAIDLTYPQYLVMLVLWERDEVTVKNIGSKLHLNTNTLTPLLKRLETRGLINRVRSTVDERKVLIQLTEGGNELKYKSKDIPKNLIKELTKEEKYTMEDIQKMKDSLDKINLALLDLEQYFQ